MLCERELPCDARFELKLWRVITPEKPRPFVVPVTSTSWPTSNVSTPTTSPGLNFASSSVVTWNSFSMSPASTPAFARWPAMRLRDARCAALAERDLHGGVAVGVRRLDLRDAVVRHVEHGHRDRRCRRRRRRGSCRPCDLPVLDSYSISLVLSNPDSLRVPAAIGRAHSLAIRDALLCRVTAA